MRKQLVLALCAAMLLTACSSGGGDATTAAAGADTTAAAGDSAGETKGETTGEAAPTGAAASSTGNVKDTIVIANEAEPTSLDPACGNGLSVNLVDNLIYDSLVDRDQEGNILPRLATEWEFIDDTHIQFKLREDVVFSNGNPFTASDVIFSLNRTLDEPTALSTMVWYSPDESSVVDDHTVIVGMHEPYAAALYVLAGGRTWIGDEETITEMGADAHARMPVGTGPYKLTEWVSGSSLSLTANENYWGEQPATPNVRINVIAEPNNRVIALETGEADQALYVSGSDIDRVNAIDGYRIEQGPSEKYYLITMAMDCEKLSDIRVRQALCYALDKNALVAGSFDGGAHVLNGYYPSMVEGFKDFGEWEYDPQKATELLNEAGATGLELELHILPGTEYQRMAQIVQAYWEAVGIKVNIEQSALATREAQGPWETSIRIATADEISNILIIYEKEFGSRLAPNDDHLDSMLKELKTIYDTDERLALEEEIQDYLDEIRFSIPFAEVDTIYGVSDKIENYVYDRRIDRQNIVDWVVYE